MVAAAGLPTRRHRLCLSPGELFQNSKTCAPRAGAMFLRPRTLRNSRVPLGDAICRARSLSRHRVACALETNARAHSFAVFPRRRETGSLRVQICRRSSHKGELRSLRPPPVRSAWKDAAQADAACRCASRKRKRPASLRGGGASLVGLIAGGQRPSRCPFCFQRRR